jgi:hypothetical protein
MKMRTKYGGKNNKTTMINRHTQTCLGILSYVLGHKRSCGKYWFFFEKKMNYITMNSFIAPYDGYISLNDITFSTKFNPETGNFYNGDELGQIEVFLTKLNPTSEELIYSLPSYMNEPNIFHIIIYGFQDKRMASLWYLKKGESLTVKDTNNVITQVVFPFTASSVSWPEKNMKFIYKESLEPSNMVYYLPHCICKRSQCRTSPIKAIKGTIMTYLYKGAGYGYKLVKIPNLQHPSIKTDCFKRIILEETPLLSHYIDLYNGYKV